MPDEPQHIEDPATHEQIREWAAAEMFEGRTAESCVEELESNGWHPHDVAMVIEEAVAQMGASTTSRLRRSQAAQRSTPGLDSRVPLPWPIMLFFYFVELVTMPFRGLKKKKPK
jgi:hypothetical protein